MSVGVSYASLDDTVAFYCTYRSSNGSPISNQDVRIRAFDVSDNSRVVDDEAMVEILNEPGLYKYVYNNSSNAPQTLFVMMFEVLNAAADKLEVIETYYVTITDMREHLTEKIDENDGQAM